MFFFCVLWRLLYVAFLLKLERLTFDSNLSLIDQEFVHNVACDIELFVKKRLSSGVLLFPPVGNYRRYLIHQTCENYRHKYDLFTFSVGQGPQRRTVLCFRNQLIDPHGFETRKIQQQNQHQTVKNWRSTTRSSSANRKRVTELCKMGVKKHISETPLSKSNSVDLYRPPALRKNSSEEAAAESTSDQQPKAATASSSTTTATATAAGTSTTSKSSPNREQQQQLTAAAATRRERRPDRAVYVPRARRSQTTPPTTTTVTAATTTATSTTVETATVADITSPKADDTTNSNNSNGNGHQATTKSKKPSKRREQRVKKVTEKPWEDPEASATLLVIDKQPASALRETKTQLNQGGAGDEDSIGNCDKDKEIMSGNQQHKMANKNGTKQLLSTALRIEDASSNSSASAEDANKCDNDVQELQRASKEINRSNRRIMKQTFISDVLEIPDKIEIKPKAQKVATDLPQQQPPPADSTTEDDEEDEDDWENMFDESGDCLDPKILQELTDSVGKCKIELPKMDYTVYHIKQSLLNEEEFPHVLEVSNFPVEFKTPDLLMLFSQYKGTGFDIKWVDDTHALAVFSSSRIAAEVLTMGHPFVKLKPLAEATLESRLKAKKAATSLQPYRQRPETCTALARRLVSGALGVKLPTAPEERENERRVLREAKERKLLAAKQRDEAWES
ncbi:R3H and coiled-coil domain-containing protein 1 [Drosophila tropicalis]|uniref:R3H and coiled-coil domain-containing protein 1 n=1 Tax=Drosophila tropicalis TaxID=46794 RepID=UPI0035AC276C